MVCDKCAFYKSQGFNFCYDCGEDLSGIEVVKKPSSIPVPEKEKVHDLFFVLGILVAIAASVLLIFQLGVALFGANSVFSNIEEIVGGDNPPVIFILVPGVVDLFELNATSFPIYYTLLLLAIILSAAFFFFKGAKGALKISEDGGESAFNTALFEMPILFGMMFVFEVIYLLIVVGDATIVAPDDTPIYVNLYQLLNASVWEEFLTRFCLIGLPMAVFLFATKSEKASWKTIFGGFGFNVFSVCLIVFSAIIFASGHMTNWPLWKWIPTFVFGLLAGYLFVKYGLYASIMMHFINDYLSAESWVTGNIFEPMTMTILFAICILSLPFFYHYGKKIFENVRKLKG